MYQVLNATSLDFFPILCFIPLIFSNKSFQQMKSSRTKLLQSFSKDIILLLLIQNHQLLYFLMSIRLFFYKCLLCHIWVKFCQKISFNILKNRWLKIGFFCHYNMGLEFVQTLVLSLCVFENLAPILKKYIHNSMILSFQVTFQI